jgi:ribosomal protein S18 acetylase RimI-like enzyme
LKTSVRKATIEDIPRLVELENLCFETDRISKQSFNRLFKKGHCSIIVDIADDIIRGYVLILFRRGTSLSRLYSIAVDPQYRKQGVAESLVKTGEQNALDNDTISMRLEIRRDNTASINFFVKMGYILFGEIPDYYEDGMEALRYEKFLAKNVAPKLSRVPYYEQTLDFTCGPATLMMAMGALESSIAFDRTEELRIWRESTTIFMASGHGGCSPYGLALAALNRGYLVDIFIDKRAPFLINSVRNEEKKIVMRLVEEDFLEVLRVRKTIVNYRSLSVSDIEKKYNEGAVPIALISSYRIYKEKFPHWVVVTGFNKKYIFIHDSYVDDQNSQTDSINMPILKTEFDRMTRYGKTGQKAVILIYPKTKN